MAYIRGLMDWSVDVDDDGNRTYTAEILVDLESYSLGPAAALQIPGMPLPGSFWAVGGDIDVYAKWRWGGSVRKHDAPAGEPTNLYIVTKKASTKAEKRDHSGNPNGGNGQQNPLDVKDQISGSSVKYQEEDPVAVTGYDIKTRVGELVRGPTVEWDKSRFTISYEQKRQNVEGGLCISLLDNLNDRPMWGFPARSVKLSSFGFDRLYYNDTYVYYSRKFEFEIRTRKNTGETRDTRVATGALVGDWDRWIREEGTMVWMGKWNKTTFTYVRTTVAGLPIPVPIRFVDIHDQPARTLLKDGLPFVPNPANLNYKPDLILATGDPTEIASYPSGGPPVKHYEEANLLGLLGLSLTI